MLVSAPPSGSRFAVESTMFETRLIATAGPGPSSAAAVICTVMPAVSRTRRAQTTTESAIA
jgi:hypothetical protein